MVSIKSNNAKSCPPELEILDAISGKWTPVILHILSEKTMRHSDLQRALDGISQKVLTQFLRKLERHGLIARTIHPVVPPRVEYSITPLGKSVSQIFDWLYDWAVIHKKDVESARSKFDKTTRK